MKEITIIFPHQLFKQHPALKAGRPVYLVEEALFFNQYNFHRQKIILHRASMKTYAGFLLKKNFTVQYIDAASDLTAIRNLLLHLSHQHISAIHFADVVDNWLRKRIIKSCKEHGIEMIEYATPDFLNTMDEVKSYFDQKKTYFQTDFYIHQRKQRNILMDTPSTPEGGQWSFDADNRLKFPKTAVPPIVTFGKENEYVKEAKEYVAKNYATNYGEVEKFIYPTDYKGAEKWLDEFLQERFVNFGIYEDAIVANQHFLNHAVLTPMLNIGLLLPQQIIDKAMAAAAQYKVPLNSLEGFIRQIMGWREFIRIVYEREGSRQRTKNYWGFTRKIPACFWTGGYRHSTSG